MLAIDMRQMSSQDLHRVVQERCADCGSVDAVKIIPSEEGIVPSLALVLMSSRDDALQLHRQIGDALTGQVVVVFLRDRAGAQPSSRHQAPAICGAGLPS